VPETRNQLQVSAVYPEAKAEFDTTAIRLYASPAPLQRRPLRLASVSNIPEPVPVPTETEKPKEDDYLRAFRAALGETPPSIGFRMPHWRSATKALR